VGWAMASFVRKRNIMAIAFTFLPNLLKKRKRKKLKKEKKEKKEKNNL